MSEKKVKILIVDDEKNAREGLMRALNYQYEATTAESAEHALQLLQEQDFAIVLTDLRMPGMDGMRFTQEVVKLPHAPLVILLTAYGSIQTALEAMKVGAYDYLTKPINLDNLEMVIERGLTTIQQTEEEKARGKDKENSPFSQIIGKSPAMLSVFDRIRQIATARTTILLTGESGTGKELVAHAIHQAGNRQNNSFVSVHCAALNENLLESELFGHEKGAFTGAIDRSIGRFEKADGGTLFLDEIGEISSSLQIKLLRVLETRSFERVGGNETIKVDVRLIAATNRDLKEEVKKRNFREDLYYRLNVVNIHLPSLRERKEDIPLLLSHYLTIFCEENGKKINGFTQEALNVLSAYSWPGNVRELRNCVERMVVFARGSTLSMQDIPEEIQNGLGMIYDEKIAKEPEILNSSGAILDMTTNEKRLIESALDKCRGNRTEAAKILGISRRTLYRKLDEFGLNEK